MRVLRPFLLSLATTLLAAAASFATDDPVNYYPGDGSGADISATHISADVPNGGAISAYTAGVSGQAFTFDGVNQAVSISSAGFFQNVFTVGFWMKDGATSAAPQKSDAQVIGQSNARKSTNAWGINQATGAGSYELRTAYGGASIPFTITQGDWHYVVLTRENLKLTLFVDGVVQGTSQDTAAYSVDFNTGIRMGTDRNATSQWKGVLDEVRFYDRVLAPFEVAQLSKSGSEATVTAKANPYLAGATGSTTANGGTDTLAADAPVSVPVTELQDLLISAAGAVDLTGSTNPTASPAGNVDDESTYATHAAENGLASYKGPSGALVGVFLSASAPTGTAPAGLDYSSDGSAGIGTNNSPHLREVFYIGNGKRDSGIGHFYVPQGATRLLLGVLDAAGNFNNTGTVKVHIVDAKAAGPYTRTISGKSDIYMANFSGSYSSDGGLYPPTVVFPAAAGRTLTFTSIAGEGHIDATNDNSGNGPNGPDGGTYHSPIDVAATNGLSGYKASATGAVVGVFLTGTSVPATTPAKLDFSGAGATNFTSLSPLIGQVFFVGDGLSADGKPQKFNVPAAATQFFLGIVDGSDSGGAVGGYGDNDGQYTATFQLSAGTTTGGGGSPLLTIRAAASVNTTPSQSTKASIGDDITYTFHWENTGTAKATSLVVTTTVPEYIEDKTNLKKQFAETDLTFNQYGHYLPASSATARDARVVWQVSDLDPSFSQEVTLGVHLSTNVRIAQQIGLGNDYSVASLDDATVKKTGIQSGSPNVSIDIGGALRFTAVPDVTTVAPGGYITYTVKLENLSSTAAPAAAAVLKVPEHTRFVGFGLDKKGKPINDPAGSVDGVLAAHPNSINGDEVLLFFGKIAGKKSSTAKVTVQAQWIAPINVSGQKLALLDYGAAFLTGANVATYLKAANDPSSFDFYSFIKDPTNSSSLSNNDSGTVNVTIAGPVTGAPDLALLKALGDDSSTDLDDIRTEDQDDGELLNTTEPGRLITLYLGAINNGDNPAEEVYVQDRLPVGTILSSGGKKPVDLTSTSKTLDDAVSFALKTSSSKKSKKFTVTLASDQRTLRVSGLHLEPHDSIGLSYSVRVKDSGIDAPSVNQILDAGASTVGSASVTQTPAGFPAHTFIKVTGKASLTVDSLPFPRVRNGVSSDVNATAATMSAFYKKNPSYIALAPGVQRFYLHYANVGKITANNGRVTVPLPTDAVFFRATGVKKGLVTALPNNSTVSTPANLATGTVIFNLGTLTPGEEGDVMVESIVKNTSSTIAGDGSGINFPLATISDGAALAPLASASSAAPLSGQKAKFTIIPLSDPTHVPKLALMTTTPGTVKPGTNFDVFLTAMNIGDRACPDPIITFVVPTGAKLVSITYGTNVFTYSATESQAGHPFSSTVASNNGPITENQTDRLKPHSAGSIKVTFQVTGPDISLIGDMKVALYASYLGHISAAPTGSAILSTPGLLPVNYDATVSGVQNADFVCFPRGLVIPLGGGNIVASGAGNIVASGAGNIVASGGGNIIASGGGNAISLTGIAALGDVTGAGLLSNLSPLVASGGGNLFNGGAGNLISEDGGGVISNDGGSIVLKVSNLVASGAGNIVASGAGNIVASGAGNIVASGGGNIVASGAGNIVASGAGNFLTFGGAAISSAGALVASGGGNLVASGGGNLVASGGGNLVLSLPSSSALVASGGGNVVIGGGGSLVASGGGN